MRIAVRCLCLLWLAVAPAAQGKDDADLVAAIRAAAQPLTGAADDYDGLLAAVGAARIVLLGEATHGSAEFYRERMRITRRLIENKGFNAVVFEAPFDPVRRLDAYVRGATDDADAAFAGFERFPRWLWRNAAVRDFADWLRERNRGAGGAPVRLFGIDLYSVPESAQAVVDHLAARAPDEAAAARRDYACFAPYGAEPQDYGNAVETEGAPSCGTGARRQLALLEVRRQLAGAAGSTDEALATAWLSAHVVAAGEDYYRAMYRPGVSSWNRRERHLADMLDRLGDMLAAQRGAPAKLVVWAHNIHQGDARATDQAAAGETSLGQAMRERHPGQSFALGFATYAGTVRAAAEWGHRDRVRRLRPALQGSVSALMHAAGLPAFFLDFRRHPELAEALAAPRAERAVGVAYLPHSERASHYFKVRVSRQFDALIHIDRTTALVPMP